MAVINYVIPEQSFEKIRSKIAVILADEIANQFTLTSDPLFNATVWLERFIPFDKTELPAINVYFNSTNFDDKTQNTNRGTNIYNIECIVSAKDTDSENGDKIALFNVQKLVGVIRFILENQNYFKLGFSENFIFSTLVSAVNISQPQNNQDGTHVASAQLTFEVVAGEYNGELQVTPSAFFTTQIKLAETDKGFFIQINN